MEEIQLSNNIHQIEFEINYHKQVAGQSIWEIGRRLNHVKQHDLTHGEFNKWAESIGIDRRTAHKFMKVADELPNDSTFSHLGTSALYLIATLPEEEREREHVTSKGETKTVDEMTVREIQELKKRLKDQEAETTRNAQKVRELTIQNQKLKEKEPKVIEKEIVKEVNPADYNDLKHSNQSMQKRLKRLEGDLELAKERYNLLESSTENARALEKHINSLKDEKNKLSTLVDKTIEFNEKIRTIHQFFDKEMASMRFKPLVNELQDSEAINRLSGTITLVESWAHDMRDIIPQNGRTIIEGEIIND